VRVLRRDQRLQLIRPVPPAGSPAVRIPAVDGA
jgi:hypothetical protein